MQLTVPHAGTVSKLITFVFIAINDGRSQGQVKPSRYYIGRAIRVTQVIDGKTQYNLYNLSDAQVGDVWTNTSRSHCGIVRRINSNEDGERISVRVEHCSSG